VKCEARNVIVEKLMLSSQNTEELTLDISITPKDLIN
jgi:hypothetical protein